MPSLHDGWPRVLFCSGYSAASTLTQGCILPKIQPDLSYRRGRSIKSAVKEWSKHKIKAISELSTLENPYMDSLYGLIYEFDFWTFSYLIGKTTCDLLWVESCDTSHCGDNQNQIKCLMLWNLFLNDIMLPNVIVKVIKSYKRVPTNGVETYINQAYTSFHKNVVCLGQHNFEFRSVSWIQEREGWARPHFYFIFHNNFCQF